MSNVDETKMIDWDYRRKKTKKSNKFLRINDNKNNILIHISKMTILSEIYLPHVLYIIKTNS